MKEAIDKLQRLENARSDLLEITRVIKNNVDHEHLRHEVGTLLQSVDQELKGLYIRQKNPRSRVQVRQVANLEKTTERIRELQELIGITRDRCKQCTNCECK